MENLVKLEPAVTEAVTDSLKHFKKRHVDELKVMRNPPALVKLG